MGVFKYFESLVTSEEARENLKAKWETVFSTPKRVARKNLKKLFNILSEDQKIEKKIKVDIKTGNVSIIHKDLKNALNNQSSELQDMNLVLNQLSTILSGEIDFLKFLVEQENMLNNTKFPFNPGEKEKLIEEIKQTMKDAEHRAELFREINKSAEGILIKAGALKK